MGTRSPLWTSTQRSQGIPRVQPLMLQEAMSGKHQKARILYHRQQSRLSQPLVLVRTRAVAGVTPQVRPLVLGLTMDLGLTMENSDHLGLTLAGLIIADL